MRWPWSRRRASSASAPAGDSPQGDRHDDVQAGAADAENDRDGYPHCGSPQGPATAATLRGSPPPISQQDRGSIAHQAHQGIQFDAPHCGAGPATETASPCGEPPPTRPPPQGGRRDPADVALGALADGWREEARRIVWSASAKDLAIEFRRRMQQQPDLIGRRLLSAWIERNYPAFCRSCGLSWWPPFTEFAAELKGVMPPKRCEIRRGGKRVGTVTGYLVPDPATAVVDLGLRRASIA
jgi:hypothetical protein